MRLACDGLETSLVDDGVRLAAAVDALIHRNKDARKRIRKIALRERHLGRMVDSATWTLLLELEALQNARWSEPTLALCRWAFTEGVRCGGRRRG
jgi:hypothetical protein